MNQQIQKFLIQLLPNQPIIPEVGFMDEEEFHEWLEQRLLQFVFTKDIDLGVSSLFAWCKANYQSSIGLVNQYLVLLAHCLLKSQPQKVEELMGIVKLTAKDSEIQQLINLMQDSQQSQVSLQVLDSPKVLKVDDSNHNNNFIQNLIDFLKCKDKKHPQ